MDATAPTTSSMETGSQQPLNSVRSLLQYPFERRTMVEKFNVKELGPDQPDVKISQQDKEKGKLYTRRFSQNWYTRKQWLAGCNHANALFCFLCLLFKTAGIHRRWMWNLCLIGDPIHSLTEECSASVQQPTKKRRTFGQGEQQLGAELQRKCHETVQNPPRQTHESSGRGGFLDRVHYEAQRSKAPEGPGPRAHLVAVSQPGCPELPALCGSAAPVPPRQDLQVLFPEVLLQKEDQEEG
ncbi:uncharacterized protein [Nothobranchius furzeri]|uniref:uncharacterized protein n=1 Tax=Nothobranchius furzeri TaxID=105023 RepID=UPI003904CA82